MQATTRNLMILTTTVTWTHKTAHHSQRGLVNAPAALLMNVGLIPADSATSSHDVYPTQRATGDMAMTALVNQSVYASKNTAPQDNPAGKEHAAMLSANIPLTVKPFSLPLEHYMPYRPFGHASLQPPQTSPSQNASLHQPCL